MIIYSNKEQDNSNYATDSEGTQVVSICALTKLIRAHGAGRNNPAELLYGVASHLTRSEADRFATNFDLWNKTPLHKQSPGFQQGNGNMCTFFIASA